MGRNAIYRVFEVTLLNRIFSSFSSGVVKTENYKTLLFENVYTGMGPEDFGSR